MSKNQSNLFTTLLVSAGALFLFKKKQSKVAGIGNSNTNGFGVLTFREKINSSGEPIKLGNTIIVNASKLIGNSTKSLYIRKGFKNGTLFLSQRHNGTGGAGDVCSLHENIDMNVNSNLFDRIYQLADKSNALI